jgi:hypothetical protein
VRFRHTGPATHPAFGDGSVSALAHRLPGGMLLTVPAHGQHRGRLFLLFADPDPKNAEVLSKVRFAGP